MTNTTKAIIQFTHAVKNTDGAISTKTSKTPIRVTSQAVNFAIFTPPFIPFNI